MKYIIISPWSQKLKGDKPNPKNFPKETWDKLVEYVINTTGFKVVQIGLIGEQQIARTVPLWSPSLEILEVLVTNAVSWIAVDNFLQHFISSLGEYKPGMVLWSVSDPNIFGYSTNVNLLKSREYLRPNSAEGQRRGMDNQFCKWDMAKYDPQAFLSAEEICEEFSQWGFQK